MSVGPEGDCLSAVAKDSYPNLPLQLAELHEDLIALVLHLPVDAQDLHLLHQRLQGLSIVFHTRTRAVEEKETLSHQLPGSQSWARMQRRADVADQDPLGTVSTHLLTRGPWLERWLSS